MDFVRIEYVSVVTGTRYWISFAEVARDDWAEISLPAAARPR